MLRKLLVATAMILGSLSVTAADLKIGVVDMQAVLAKSPQRKTINEKIQKQFKEKQDALIALQKKGKELQDKMKRDEMTMTVAQKIDSTRQLQALDSEFKLKKTFLDEDLSIAQKQELQKIQVKVIQAIKKVAADEKFDLILRAEAAVHATDAANITDKVIAIISNPAG